jgi:asparagine synthase (glutamine-hydrolysing)
MCGIVGLFKTRELDYPRAILDEMRDEVVHRGPDDKGSIWFVRENGLIRPAHGRGTGWEYALGNRRLSVQDLTPAGHQPLSYRDTLWITFNGEIYNFPELRAELESLGHTFSSNCDTEVILASYAEWGTNCFARFRGMWALILLDTRLRVAIVSRDRLGIKPAYICRSHGLLAVVSEIKQLVCLPDFRLKLNSLVASEYLATGYETDGQTFLQDVNPVPVGSWVAVSLDTLEVSPEQRFWFPDRVDVSVHDSRDAAKLFACKLEESVRLHLRSDVEVGCALSGGLDSTALVTLMNRIQGNKPINTFSAVFPGSSVDESSYIEHITRLIPCVSHRVTPTAERLEEELGRLVNVHDEPICDISLYASYCVARLTSEAGVKVCLNGQGGDEILGGYWQSYLLYLRDLGRGGEFLQLALHLARAVGRSGNRTLFRQVRPMYRRYRARQHPAVVNNNNNDRLRPSNLVMRALKLPAQERRVEEIRTFYLPRLLRWEDRNMMAFSVEGRYPFLDHELIELCLSFAPSTLYDAGWNKMPLRSGLAALLPVEIAKRRTKSGFETPQTDWLKGSLKPLISKWLGGERRIWAQVPQSTAKRVADSAWHAKPGEEEASQDLFRLFMFDKWLESYGVDAPDHNPALCEPVVG